MPRPAWSGFLRLSLVSVPVHGYTTLNPGDGEIHLNQLHKTCHSRIRYKKVCPIHGEVSNDEIVMGYEFTKDQYVEVEESERKRARTKSDKAVDIETFVPIHAVDPIYLEGRSYYLLPDGSAGQKPYAVLYAAMEKEDRCAVAQVALSGRDQVVVITPEGGLLLMYLLYFHSQLKPREEFVTEAPSVKLRADELKLARTLIENSFSETLDLSKYEDTYTDRMKEIIEAKVEGHKVVNPPNDDEAPPTINLMDALRRSVAQGKPSRKPAKKIVASARALTPAKRRRKSS